MPFVPVPRTAEVEAVYLLDGQIVENTYYFRNAGTPVLSDLVALADEINSAIRTSLLPSLASALQLIRVVATLLDAVDSLVYVSTTSLPASGGSADEVMPSNVAACISLRTSHRGRSFRGRNYVTGLPNGFVAGNVITPPLAGAITTAYTAILAAPVDAGWEPVVVSRYSGFTIVDGRKVPTPREEGIATPITSHFLTDNTVDSQRRRLPGRGR